MKKLLLSLLFICFAFISNNVFSQSEVRQDSALLQIQESVNNLDNKMNDLNSQIQYLKYNVQPSNNNPFRNQSFLIGFMSILFVFCTIVIITYAMTKYKYNKNKFHHETLRHFADLGQPIPDICRLKGKKLYTPTNHKTPLVMSIIFYACAITWSIATVNMIRNPIEVGDVVSILVTLLIFIISTFLLIIYLRRSEIQKNISTKSIE